MSTEVYMYRNVTEDEGGIAQIEIRRDGDLSQGAGGTFALDFSERGAGFGDIEWYRSSGDGSAAWDESNNLGYFFFGPGDDRIVLQFRLTDDTQTEDDESIYVELLSAVSADIGDSRDYIRIRDNDEPIEIDIRNADTVDEGGTLAFDIRATDDVSGRVQVFYEVYSGAGNISSVQRTGSVFINTGQDRSTLHLQTLVDADTSDETVRVRITGVSGDTVQIDDNNGYGNVNDTTMSQPALSLHDGGFVDEGNFTGSFARLSAPTTHDVTFTVTTYYGTFDEANAGGHGGDYGGLIERQFTIEAGQTIVPIPVYIKPDDHVEGYERFELRVGAGSVSGATVGDDRETVTIRDTTQAPTPQPDPVAESEDLAPEMGGEEVVPVAESEDSFWQTVWDYLPDWIKPATANAASIPSPEDIDVDMREVRNLRLDDVQSDDPNHAVNQVVWWNADNLHSNGAGLRAGDVVYHVAKTDTGAYEYEYRLVINQPLIAFTDAANTALAEFRSAQGRFDDQKTSAGLWDATSHGVWKQNPNTLHHSIDYSDPNGDLPTYIVAPIAGEIVYVDNAIGAHNAFLGNIVTMKTAGVGGGEIYITMAHLTAGSIPDWLQPGTQVKAGDILGLMDATRQTWNGTSWDFDYDPHLHMQVGKSAPNDKWADATSASNGDWPEVYMLFGDADIAERHEINSGVNATEDLPQDYGFPIGDYDGGDAQRVARNIESTIDIAEFEAQNPVVTIRSADERVMYSDNKVYAVFQVHLYEDLGLTQEIDAAAFGSYNLRFSTFQHSAGGEYVGEDGRATQSGENEDIIFNYQTGKVYVELLDYDTNWRLPASTKYFGLAIDRAAGVIIDQAEGGVPFFANSTLPSQAELAQAVGEYPLTSGTVIETIDATQFGTGGSGPGFEDGQYTVGDDGQATDLSNTDSSAGGSGGSSSGGQSGTTTQVEWSVVDPMFGNQTITNGESFDVDFQLSSNTDPDTVFTYLVSNDTVASVDDNNLIDYTRVVDEVDDNGGVDSAFNSNAYLNTPGTYYVLVGQFDSSAFEAIGDYTVVEQLTVLGESPISRPTTHFHDGDGTLADPTKSWETFTERFWGTDGDDVIDGGSGNDNFVATLGNDYYQGGVGDNQYTIYEAGVAVLDYVWSHDQGDDILRGVHAVLGTDYFDGDVDGFWSATASLGGATWVSRQTIIDNWADTFDFGGSTPTEPSDPPVDPPSPDTLVFTMVDGDGTDVSAINENYDEEFAGTAGDDVVDGGAGNNYLLSSGGTDYFRGGDGNDQYVLTHAGVATSDYVWSHDAGANILRGVHTVGTIFLETDTVESIWNPTASTDGSTWHAISAVVGWADSFVYDGPGSAEPTDPPTSTETVFKKYYPRLQVGALAVQCS